jgi:hypothetical protein
MEESHSSNYRGADLNFKDGVVSYIQTAMVPSGGKRILRPV